jgi:hypothetical protein
LFSQLIFVLILLLAVEIPSGRVVTSSVLMIP